jgi:hypothetical protein
MLYIAAMAKEAVDGSELQRKRLRRAAAAAYLTDKLGPNVSPNTLRSWPIPYKQLGRDATYEIRDLDAFAEARIAGAAVRRPGPSPDFAAMFEERRRLLIPDQGVDEGTLRARDYVIRAYQDHFKASLEDAKRTVMAAIAAGAKPKETA